MSLMVTFKNEVVRICPKNAKKIEASKNNGISWSSRYTGSYIFQDLTVSGNEPIKVCTVQKMEVYLG